MEEQAKKTFNYCLILGDHLESLICLRRALKLNKNINSVFCYYFKDRDGKMCAFPLSFAFYDSGDFTVMDKPFDLSEVSIIYLDDDFNHQMVEVNNSACDKIFEDRILEINRKYVLSLESVAASFMQQMGFPSECIDEYLRDGSVYLYDGFYREKITENNYPMIKDIIKHLGSKIYAVVPEHFENTYCYLLWNPQRDAKELTPLTQDNRFGKISFLHCAIGNNFKCYDCVGIMTSNGGVWSIPNDIASMQQYNYKFTKNNY